MLIWVRSRSGVRSQWSLPFSSRGSRGGEGELDPCCVSQKRSRTLQLPDHYFAVATSPTHHHNMTTSKRNQTRSAPYVFERWVGTLCCVFCLSGCFSNTDKIAADREVLKNRCLAILENGVATETLFLEAAGGFRTLAKELPSERLGVQNLCVTLLLRLQKIDQAESAEQFAALKREFESSIRAFKALVPNEPDADVLMSRFHQIENDRDLAIQSMKIACRAPRATADTYFQLYQLLQMDAKPEHVPEMLAAIKSAVKLAPSNLVLAVALLDTLAKSKDAGVKQEAERCSELFKPLVARTVSRIPTLLEAATIAVDKGDWKGAESQAARLRNVLLAEIAFKNDLHQLDPHELEYVQLNFSEQFQKQKTVPKRSGSSTWRLETRDVLPFASTEVTAIAADDMDLDGYSDLICASGKQLDVWKTNGLSSSKNLISSVLEISCTGIALADFDHDYQVRKDALPPSALPTTAAPDAKQSDPLLAKFLDTDLDVVVYGPEGIRLYRNDLEATTGARSLTGMPQSEEFVALRGVRTVAVIDFDHDSDLDLVVSSASGISLWSNRGDWTFADFTPYSDLPAETKKVDSILAMDLDRNVLNDFMLGSEELDKPVFLSNNLHGRYHPSSLDWKSNLKGACRAIDAIDANGDACWDLVLCGKQGTKIVTMKSVGRHGWVPDQVTTLSTTAMLGVVVCDLDFDGFSDCMAWGDKGIELFRGGQDGRLLLEQQSVRFAESTLQAVTMDFDRDGDDDVVCLTQSGVVKHLENQGGNANQHLELVIRADEDGKQDARQRCNMHGVGGLIEIKSAGRYQSRIVRGPTTKFGLGKESQVDIMRVLWTNGIPNNVLKVSNRSTVFDQQNLGGSCPYLYAWNGERFEFCTDCLWAAPIGLQFAQGVSAPTREWEYLKLDGNQVKPRDGRYVLQITEELWEAAYFDAVQLMAVDHPADVEIYTNEKVGPPDLAQFRVHTVRNRLKPKSVSDQRGNDLSELVGKRDLRFTRCWNEGFNQGLVEDHWLEIDLNGEPKSGDEVMLFLTGWVFPTCTSLNLAMTENPLRPRLSPPSVWVPDEAGKWVEAIPYAGFPGGKTKTIAIDLSGKFKSNDHRVRIVTNMELSWDEVFWTNGDEKAETPDYRLTRLELLKADLHYRGFSKLIPRPANAPKQFVYDRLTTESIWPPMSGRFTRFGNVKELIEQADDMQVVLGAGDEMTVEFSVGNAELPAGWKRDFIIYNIGWDKDADLNTVHGQSVEPLPFRAMSKYPYEPDQSFPSEPKHIDFLKRYQTRLQSPGSFWDQVREN